MTTARQNQTHWTALQILGIQRIEKVVAEFYVECSYVPSRYFRVKVTEDGKGNYLGRLNVSLKNAVDQSPEWIVGLGLSVDSALADAIQQFLHLLEQCGKDQHNLTEADLEWAECEDF